MAKKKRDNLKIVVVGHVDHGKSTVIGKLLYDTNSLPEGAVEKVRRIAKETGKPFEYAYLLDAFEEEQKQGITIDTTQIQFFTDQRDYVIIDAPGHKEFLKNMISGAANASAALLIIDAKQGVQEQSKRHAYMLSLLGIKNVYVVINKMDLVDYDAATYHRVASEMKEFITPLGVTPLRYIPVSGLAGENIATASDKMPWYTDQPLLVAMDELPGEQQEIDKPLRFPIQDVYKFDNRRIIAGRIEAGKLAVGDEIVIWPSGKKTHISTLAYWAPRDRKNKGYAGQSVGITVRDEFFNKRGELITLASEPAPHISNRLLVSLFWMGKTPLKVGKKYRLKLATQEVEVEVESINKVIDASSLDSSDDTLKEIKLNDVGEVILRTKEEIAFDTFRENQGTGRFVIVDGYDVTGGGIVNAAEKSVAETIQPAFVKDELVARGELFDEFYYNVGNNEVAKSSSNHQVYAEGDAIPLTGESYTYPANFDVLVLRDKVSILIRDGKVDTIQALDDYKYTGAPLVNGRGFALYIANQKDLQNMLVSYDQLESSDYRKRVEFANRYYSFGRFRKVVFDFDYII